MDTFNTTSFFIGVMPPNISTLATTTGPQFASQIMRFNNQTVVSKVPEEVLHLIDPYW